VAKALQNGIRITGEAHIYKASMSYIMCHCVL
jgi:hypothetical protein